ncbi:hypothetical protein [Noviherbaspirillum saxi]|uniref:hypothetical protein n=1 Tax=Noviherbaspirillum saxi TaxID=2320863 RepID=UPI0011C41AA8|nr:hypothetical protein [Noviherbaspirillum saxi]
MDCIEFFSQNSGNKQKCKDLQKLSQEQLVGWEGESASAHSPGPVQDNEILCRQIVSPVHYDPETNSLTAAAFSDASSFGMSVNRLAHASQEYIEELGENRVFRHNQGNPEKERLYLGTIQFLCADVRQITVQFETDPAPLRGFGVYDTALETDRSHADICELVHQKAHTRSIRLSLRDLANRFIAGVFPQPQLN